MIIELDPIITLRIQSVLHDDTLKYILECQGNEGVKIQQNLLHDDIDPENNVSKEKEII